MREPLKDRERLEHKCTTEPTPLCMEYSLQEGETITPVLAPTKEGFTFSGWSEIPETMPDHDVTITGTFIANTYLPGDANGDGKITVTDIGVIVDIILGKTPANARKQQEVEAE